MIGTILSQPIMIATILFSHDSLLRPLVFALITIHCFLSRKNIFVWGPIDKTIELF